MTLKRLGARGPVRWEDSSRKTGREALRPTWDSSGFCFCPEGFLKTALGNERLGCEQACVRFSWLLPVHKWRNLGGAEDAPLDAAGLLLERRSLADPSPGMTAEEL